MTTFMTDCLMAIIAAIAVIIEHNANSLNIVLQLHKAT